MNTPKRYTKKPVTIEAVQWTRNDAPRKLIDFTNHLVQIDDTENEFKVYDRLHDVWVPFYWDDWIIKGLKGEFYPCRSDVFEASYEDEVGMLAEQEQIERLQEAIRRMELNGYTIAGLHADGLLNPGDMKHP